MGQEHGVPTELSAGHIELICGCMFSGKTEELLRRARRTDPAAVVMFKHSRDDRYSTTDVVTHRNDRYRAINVAAAADILEMLPDQAKLVGIDEGHFFDTALAKVCRELADRGCTVIVTALDLDSWGQPFATIAELREHANTVVVKQAACARCGSPADHTQRTTPIVDRIIVGGPEAFEPRCPKCWTAPPEAHID